MSTSQDEQIEQRKANLDALTRLGVAAYPNRFPARHTVTELVDAHSATSHDELEGERPDTVTSGRILAIRSFGKANFLVLSDGCSRLQAYIRADSVSERDFRLYGLLDFGDHVGVEGHLFRTKTQELTVWA